MKNAIYFTKTFFTLTFLCTSICSFSQNTPQKDTLSHYSFKDLYQISDIDEVTDSLTAIIYAKYYIKKATLEKDTFEIGEANYCLSDVTKDISYFVNYWNGIIENTKGTKNKLYPVAAYLRLSNFYFQRGENDLALKNVLAAYNSNATQTNDSLKNDVIQKLGVLKSQNHEYQKAIELYRQSYAYFEKKDSKLNISMGHYSVLISLASTFRKIKILDSATFYNKKLHTLILENEKEDSIMLSYVSLINGTIEIEKKIIPKLLII